MNKKKLFIAVVAVLLIGTAFYFTGGSSLFQGNIHLQNNELEGKIASIEQDLKTAESEYDKIYEALQDAQKLVDQKQDEVNSAQKYLDQKQAELDDANASTKTDSKILRGSSSKTKDTKKDEPAVDDSKIKALEGEVSAAQKALDGKLKELDTAQGQVSTLETNAKDAKLNMENLKIELEDLYSQLASQSESTSTETVAPPNSQSELIDVEVPEPEGTGTVTEEEVVTEEEEVSEIELEPAPVTELEPDPMELSAADIAATLPEGLSNITATPASFSPTLGQDTTLAFFLNVFSASYTPRFYEIKIYTEDGEMLVKSLSSNDPHSLTPVDIYEVGYNWTWDGTSDKGDILPEGDYWVRIETRYNVANHNQVGWVKLSITPNGAPGTAYGSLSYDDPFSYETPLSLVHSIDRPQTVDGFDEPISIGFYAEKPCEYTVTIVQGYTLLRTIVYNEPAYVAGEYSVLWDGKDDSGELVDPGNYSLRVRAENEYDTGSTSGSMVVYP